MEGTTSERHSIKFLPSHRNVESCSFLRGVKRSIFNASQDRLAQDLKFGSDFQKVVLMETLLIPKGENISYGDLSFRIFGNGTYARAIGQTLGRNPYLIFFPCHRVVAKNGIGGYAAGVDVKKYLLSQEV